MIGLLALATGVKAAETTFTVVNNDAEGWPALALYAWEEGGRPDTELFGGWPGVVLYDGTNLTDNDKVSVTKDGNTFTVTIKDYAETMHLILNNNGNGKQIDDIDINTSVIIPAPAGEPTNFSTAIYFINDGWDAVALYNWGGGGEIYGGWPGVVIVDAEGTLNPAGNKLVKVEAAGTTEGHAIYKISLGDDTGYENLIFNNNGGGAQFDVALENGAYYNTTGKTTAPGEEIPEVSFTVVNNNPTGWPQIALYNWGESTGETLGAWPGTVLFDGTTPTDNDKVTVVKNGNTYTVTLKVLYENLILNNTNGGDGNQIDLSDFSDGKSYQIPKITTGIKTVMATGNGDAVHYNLAGQKVSGSFRGIVISNGKRYINK